MQARWHNHINHVRAPVALQHWLKDAGSLTAKLIAHSTEFNVQCIEQRRGMCWADEFALIDLKKISQVQTREVLLCCDKQPVVYARTILPISSTAHQWPLFKNLGNRSLGSTLFHDQEVTRGALQYARLRPEHPARRRAHRLTQANHPILFARRSLFFRRGGVMLVMELFLPAIMHLASWIPT
jgi:chorismate--pyruvate lyase